MLNPVRFIPVIKIFFHSGYGITILFRKSLNNDVKIAFSLYELRIGKMMK